MFRLLARRGAGSMAVEAMLAQCGTAYEVEDLVRNSDGSLPEHLHRINPRGEVPTLLLPDDSVMTESAAIMIWLADKYPKAGLAPDPISPLRAQYLRWMVYLATTVYMSDLRMYYPERFTTDAASTAGIKAFALRGIAREFEIYADALGDGPFILGNQMSATDIYAAMLLSWVPDMAETFGRHPNLKTMYDRVVAVPAIAKVWERNGV